VRYHCYSTGLAGLITGLITAPHTAAAERRWCVPPPGTSSRSSATAGSSSAAARARPARPEEGTADDPAGRWCLSVGRQLSERVFCQRSCAILLTQISPPVLTPRCEAATTPGQYVSPGLWTVESCSTGAEKQKLHILTVAVRDTPPDRAASLAAHSRPRLIRFWRAWLDAAAITKSDWHCVASSAATASSACAASTSASAPCSW
jgi:hypothetical protein